MYVDDIAIIGDDQEGIKELKNDTYLIILKLKISVDCDTFMGLK